MIDEEAKERRHVHKDEDMSEDGSESLLSKPWSITRDEVLQVYNVNPEAGLDSKEVKKRRKKSGYNRLKKVEKKNVGTILIGQFKNVLTILLTIAAIVSFLFGEWIEGIAISVVIVINAVIGFFTELRAVRSMEALYELTKVVSKVRRDNEMKEIPAEELVPGDIIVLKAGDIVTADSRLIKSSKLQVDESTLTGESIPVSKKVASIDNDVILAERENMLYKCTFITRGSAEGIVVAIGMDTELGKISSFMEEVEDEEETPLERRLRKLGQKLIYEVVCICFCRCFS
jgi:Ca2+-transporting ATPase